MARVHVVQHTATEGLGQLAEWLPAIGVDVHPTHPYLGNRVPPPIASLPGRIDTLEHEWYDFDSKYDANGMQLVIPPELPQKTIELVQQRSVDAFVACECEGLARVDFFVRASDGEVIVNELNTMPGFTATSVYAKLFGASGVSYVELVDRLIALALERHERRSSLQY